MGTTRALRRRDEAGYAAVLVALLGSVLFLGMGAIGVDTARWYVEVEHVQKTADAAALAGVTYMPNDFAKARSTALAAAAKNGYDDADADVRVTVAVGGRPSELLVTVSSRIPNAFGAGLGIRDAWVTRSAVADYTAPAPMGSPCNTFGNEPRGNTASSSLAPSGTALPGTSFTQCPKDGTTGTSQPQFWASIEGPETDKMQGDRYQANNCTETGNAGTIAYGCASGKNAEYRAEGTYFAIHVEPGMVGKPIELQVFDPAFVKVNSYCNARRNAGETNGLPTAAELDNTMNSWTNDGKVRYAGWKAYNSTTTNSTAGAKEFCTGDSYPTSTGRTFTNPATTSFVLRHQTPTNDPKLGAVINTASCPITQFRGYHTFPQYNALKSTNGSYNAGLAEVYHQWYKLCTFTPDTTGDYFLQVRTNVSLGGTPKANTNGNSPVIYTGNTLAGLAVGNTQTGAGSNSFAIRAIPSPATDTNKKLVSVSGFERMPMLQNSPDSTAIFNLVRALPNARGQYLTFDFFDAADGASSGNVKVLPPTDASGSVKNVNGIPGCKWGKDDTAPASYTSTTNCSVNVSGSVTDGHVMHMVIPIPNDYNCDNSTLGGCWFRVQMAYSGAVTDFTTWTANIGGDPVRLIE